MQVMDSPNVLPTDLTFAVMLRMLSFRLRRIFFATLFTLTIGIVYAFWLAQSVWESQATIIVKNGVYLVEGGLIKFSLGGEGDSINMPTEVIRVTSPELLQILVEDMQLDQDPEFNPTLKMSPFESKTTYDTGMLEVLLYANIREAITITVPRDTQIMQISVRSSSPEKSAKIANSLANIYISSQGKDFFDAFTQGSSQSAQENALPEALLARAKLGLQALEGTPPNSDDDVVVTLLQLDTVFKSLVGLYGYNLNYYQRARPGATSQRVSEPQIFAELLQAATVPISSVSPKRMQAVLASLILGLFGSITFTFLEAVSRGRIYDGHAFLRKFGFSVWSEVKTATLRRVDGQRPKETPLGLHDLRSALTLGTPLSDKIGTVLFMNAGSRALDVALAVGLGQSYASIGKTTLVVSEFLDPAFLSKVGLSGPQTCFQDALLEGQDERAAVLKTEAVDLMGIASCPSTAHDIYSTTAFSQALARLKEDYDVVILASQSDVSTEGMSVLQVQSDMIQVNLVEGEARQSDVIRLISKLKSDCSQPIGFVLLQPR